MTFVFTKDNFLLVNPIYIREVLGVKNYLCPEKIQTLRKLQRAWPCRYLVILFEDLTESQKNLLKRIMFSGEFYEYSLLTLKQENLLEGILTTKENWPELFFVFGINTIVHSDVLSKEQDSKEDISSRIFQTPYSIKELVGDTEEVRQKKQKLWQQLKQWKNHRKNFEK